MGEKFFDEIVDSFFEEVGEVYRWAFERGQLFWTHILYHQEDLKFWRPKNYDETKTYASEFVISSSTKDAFNRQSPLYAPKLEINEEFPVIIAKRRPVILISPVPKRIEVSEIRGGGRINLNLCLVVPLYGVEDVDGKAKYTTEFIARIRKLEFPHLSFIPESRLKGLKNSICRIDRMQACYPNQIEAIDIKLSNEVLGVLKGQIEFLLTERYDDYYQLYREECLKSP